MAYAGAAYQREYRARKKAERLANAPPPPPPPPPPPEEAAPTLAEYPDELVLARAYRVLVRLAETSEDEAVQARCAGTLAQIASANLRERAKAAPPLDGEELDRELRRLGYNPEPVSHADLSRVA